MLLRWTSLGRPARGACQAAPVPGEIRVRTPRRWPHREAVAVQQPDQAQEYMGPAGDKAFVAMASNRAAEGSPPSGGAVRAGGLETDKGAWVVVRATEPGCRAEGCPGSGFLTSV